MEKTSAQITAQFAPVPALGPIAELLCGIIQLCQNLTQNRNAAFQLRDRCHRLALMVYDKEVANESIAAVIDSLTRCLEQIYAKLSGWTQMDRVQGFLHQDEVAKDIERCHRMLSDCLESFQLISHTEIHDWQAQFRLDAEEDRRELIAYLADIEHSQAIINAALQSQSSDIQQMMAMMQQLMSENLSTANQQHSGLSSNLYDLQFKSRELLPDLHLHCGEVIRIGHPSISGTRFTNIEEGLYLGREKVAIKVVRDVNSDENTMRRLKRECEIWKKLWNLNKGVHILPFYGFCQEDGPFPYMVSPWQSNGNALTYVKNSNDKIDYLKLTRGIALGLQVLHGMNPHVVHGDLKASNVLIDVARNPLIADFDLCRLVEDITGTPFTQSRGVKDSYRWFAPEVCIGEGVLSPSSDVYAYGMTILEIFTHEQPYSYIKHTTEVVIRSARGEHPRKPTDPKVLRRGLNLNMWKLLSLCWATEPSERPAIQQVLDLFPE